jgi:hypothetical protein
MSKDRQALKKWEAVAQNIRKLKTIDFETPEAKAQRITKLKKDFVAFCEYYFPEYASAPFAKFHLKIAKKVIDNNELYLVAALAREHGKSVLLGLLLPAYLMFTDRMYNMLLVSHNKDNAEELMMPLIVNLENNQRIINDYGEQKSLGNWEAGKWKTADGCSFRAIGAGQSPRGTRNAEKRPDLILIDDIDTDEESRNQTRIDNKWKWIEQALFPTMSISGSKRFLFAGNIIAKEGCIVKAMRVADFKITVNILDKDGQPSWEERYTLKMVEYMLSKISYASGQKEYFNNPLTEGTVFKDFTWGKVPPLSSFDFLVAYTDPSYKSSKKNDFKATPLLGILNGNLYIIKMRLDQTTVARMIEWYYEYDEFVNDKTTLYCVIENGGLQDTFFEEVFTPQLIKVGEQKGKQIPVAADNRKKPDKFTRIEAALEPLNRQGRMILNEKEKNNPHMKRLVEQFEIFAPSLPGHDDGPDGVEGGWWFINNKLVVYKVSAGRRKKSSKRF